RKALSRQFVDTVKRLFIQPEERHMAALARRIAKKKGITFEDIAKGSRFRLSEWDFLKPTKNAVFLILFIALYLKQKLRTVIISAVMRCSKNPIVIFTSPVGYMKKLAYKLNASINANFYFLQRWVIPDVGASLFAKLFLKKFSGVLAMQERFSRQFCGKIREMHDLFSYRGITFTDILAEKFENDIAPYIMGLHMWTVELHGIVRRFKPSLVVSSGNRLDDSIIGELCRKINMPSIMVSHGSYVYPKNDIEIIEWGEDGKNYLRAPFSFVALQSPLDEDYTRFFPPSADAVKTGPLVWGGSVNTEKSKLTLENILGNGKKNPSKLKVILHASTQKPNNRLKFHIYETPDEYIQSLSELADAVRKIPETLLIVRFKPREDFSSDDLKSIIKFSDNIILSVREPFLDLLGMSNLLVSLSSTTITEALQNRIPVLLYGGRGRYRHIPSYEISGNIPVERRAVYHIAHEKDLRYGISGILNLGLDRNKDGDLFESYIYKEDERVSLVDLMNAGSKGTFK
ncbi:MAG: hypothetical protein JW994_04910, partial [Candidatus Omnitrophica bacterium]|nr:hypothetical protein [Candidatus Omnitrophota bacterium]